MAEGESANEGVYTEDGQHICKWCGDTFETIQALGGHTKKKHRDKPSVGSDKGKEMLGIPTKPRGAVVKGEGYVPFFSGSGEKLFNELKDSGKRVSKHNIVTHYENGNIDSPDWMNYCLKIGGVDKAQRMSIVSTHYGINPVPILDREQDYAQADGGILGGVATQRKKAAESPMDEVLKIARQDFELAQIESLTDRYRQKTEAAKPKPDNGNEGKIEIPLPDPFDPSQPLRDAKGGIVTYFVDPQQIVMEQRYGGSNLKGGKSDIPTGWEKAFELMREAIPKKGESDGDIAKNPAFIALSNQMNTVLDENRQLKENQRLGAMEGRLLDKIGEVEAKTHGELELWGRMTNLLRSEGILPEGRGLFGLGGGAGTPEQAMTAETLGFIKDRANNISKQVDKFGTIVSSDVRHTLAEKRGSSNKQKTSLPRLEDTPYEKIMEQIDESEGFQQETLD